MIDRLRALLRERAEEMAAHDGVPVADRHVHGAAHYLTDLLGQAKEGVLRDIRPARVRPAIAPAPQQPEAELAAAPKAAMPSAAPEAKPTAPAPEAATPPAAPPPEAKPAPVAKPPVAVTRTKGES